MENFFSKIVLVENDKYQVWFQWDCVVGFDGFHADPLSCCNVPNVEEKEMVDRDQVSPVRVNEVDVGTKM